MIDEAMFVREAEAMLPGLYRLSLSILRAQADAQDAVQQGMLRAWERRTQAREETLRGWMTRIVINECRNIQRRRMRVVPAERMPERAVWPHRASCARANGCSRIWARTARCSTTSAWALPGAVCMDETVGFIGMPTEIVCVNGRYAYAAMHHSAASGGEMAVHLGLILSSADGAIREYALEAVETTSPWGECQLAALGEGSVLLTQNGDALAPVPFAAELILAGIPGE